VAFFVRYRTEVAREAAFNGDIGSRDGKSNVPLADKLIH